MTRRTSTKPLNGLAALVIVASLLLGAGNAAARELPASPMSSPTVPAVEQAQPAAVAYATSDRVMLEAGGTNLEVPVTDMPDDALVAGIDLKVSVLDGPAGDLRLQAAGPEGFLVAIPLQVMTGEQESGTKRSPDDAGGQASIARTGTTSHQLDGRPAKGLWRFILTPADAALAGKTATLSLAIRYTTSLAWPVQSAGDGQPAMRSLPAPVWELAAPAAGDSGEKPAVSAGTPDNPAAWQIIKTETFEGSFPNAGWTVTDQSNDGYQRYWDDDDYKPYGGSWSAWPARGGANGLDPQYYYYPNNMNTWMVFGPFDLSNATEANTVFRLWRETEANIDFVFFGVSANGTNFTGVSWSGIQGWTEYTVNYNSFVGDGTVWVGWQFYSDSSIVDDGPFVDNITIQKNVGTCGPYAAAGGWPIPDDGSWLTVPLADPMAPAAGAVSEVSVKYLLDHPDPMQLEVKLAKAGSAVEQMLWRRGELVAGEAPGTALGLDGFAGQAAQGDWQLRVRDVMPGEQGHLAAASVRARYAPLGPVPTVVKGPAGTASALSLPAGARRITAPDLEKPASDLPGTVPNQPDAWQVIKSEGFEGTFPTAGWTLLDLSNDGCDFLWDDDDYRPHVGNYAAWPANGGADALDPALSNYPPNMNSWMIYGPFSLANATDADTLFALWREIEVRWDWIAFGVSADGTNFNTIQWDGTASWTDIQVNYQSYVGDASVWVAWIFHSDGTLQYDGPWIDEIAIRKNAPVFCGPYAESGGWPIPDDGSWLTVPLADPMAPASGTVAEVNVKYVLDHADPAQLEVKLAKAGSAVEQMLWRRGELVAGEAPGTARGLDGFAGQAAQGDWQLMVRDGVPGEQGHLAAASVRARYAPLGPVPTVVKGPAGTASALSLPAGARRMTAPDGEKRGAAGSAPLAEQPEDWQIVKTEGFEGDFPNPGWTVADLSNDGCNFLWDDDTYRPHAGSWAAWPANGGTNGLDPATSNYPPYMNSWMIYGPFSLAGATNADALFSLWREIEPNFDWVSFGVSADGTNFNTIQWDGTATWTDLQVNFQSYTGDATVWVAWIFHSDGSVQYDGPWVDEIAIRKFVPINCGPFEDGEGWTIPDDGTWLSVPLADRMAPAAGTVADANVKYVLDHPAPDQLEIKLAKAGSTVEQALWSRGRLDAGPSMGTALGLSVFEGAPAQGDWLLMVRDLAPGQQGRLAAASVRARYAPLGPAPAVVQGPAGQAGALALPADARRVTAPDREKPPAASVDSEPWRPDAWAIIKTEGFEGDFPNDGWTVADLSNDGCDFLWDDDDLKPYTGTWAGWPANGGVNGLDPAVSNYPPNMSGWMVYGPFSLMDASEAEAIFELWREIEPNFDWVAFGVSSDGSNFNTLQWSGAVDWTELQVSFDDYVDDDTVWVAWIFHSDSTIQLDGPWIDQIVLRRFNPPLRFWVPLMLNRAFQ